MSATGLRASYAEVEGTRIQTNLGLVVLVFYGAAVLAVAIAGDWTVAALMGACGVFCIAGLRASWTHDGCSAKATGCPLRGRTGKRRFCDWMHSCS
jgi:hypothetical protein